MNTGVLIRETKDYKDKVNEKPETKNIRLKENFIMNRTEFIAEIYGRLKEYESYKPNKLVTSQVVNETLNTMMDVIASGDTLSFVGFGTFSTVDTPAREGRNPLTGEPVKIAAKKRVKFKASPSFKQFINEA